jgi:hypothetical protein
MSAKIGSTSFSAASTTGFTRRIGWSTVANMVTWRAVEARMQDRAEGRTVLGCRQSTAREAATGKMA